MVPKIRRGGFIFLAWMGDHGPRHVHVYRDGTLVVKWDLDNNVRREMAYNHYFSKAAPKKT